MGLKVSEVTKDNYQEVCFVPTKKKARTKEKFLDHKEFGYRQVYNLGVTDAEISQLKNDPALIKREDINYFAQRKTVIKDKEKSIQDHVDMRIILFFEQAILCHKTPFIFSCGGAEDQIGAGTTLTKNNKKIHRTEAAHPSTLPCLHAHLKDDPTQSFIFLKNSLSYKRQNSGNELPVEVNKTDTLIDGKATDGKLRSAALKILNDDAEGKIDPVKALKRFLKVFQGQLKKHVEGLDSSDVRRKVAKIYLEKVKKVREDIKESSEIFDLIMGLQLPDNQILRDVVYKRRYNVIKEAAFVESKIAKKVFDAEKKMTGMTVKSLKSVATPLRYVLIEGAASKAERIFYEKFFSTSLEQLNNNYEKKEKQLRIARNEVAKLKQNHSHVIKELRKEIDSLRDELDFLEVEFRAQLLKGLREDYKKWGQTKFAQKFGKLYKDAPMSQPTVSRLEAFAREDRQAFYATPVSQRKKEMSISYANMIARTFKIDPGLFLPGLITSNY